nr:MFS transporter [Kineosporia babensis]
MAIAGFCVVLVGVNLPNPLVPLYTAHYGLTPLAQSVMFSVYLLALVITLLAVMLSSRPPSPHRTLVAALALCAVSDLLMMLGATSYATLLTGRLVAGVSVGLATGSAATLALAGLGERARTTVASGAVIGSLLGNVGGGLFGSVLPAPQLTVFAAHLLITLGVGAAVVLAARRSSATATEPQAQPSTVPGYLRRHRRAGLVLGAMAWSTAGVVLALVPAALREVLPEISLLEAVLPGGVFLATAWLAQLACRRYLLWLRAWQLSIPLVTGLVMIAAALEAGAIGWLLVGAVVCGLGQGPAYSLGLATVTHGLRAGRQGRAASAYAAVAYGVCGAVTTATGAYALTSDVPSAIGGLALILAAAGLIAAAFAGARQRVLPSGQVVPA